MISKEELKKSMEDYGELISHNRWLLGSYRGLCQEIFSYINDIENKGDKNESSGCTKSE